MSDCNKCALRQTCTQVVGFSLPKPPLKDWILAVGEAPGADEDVAGEGFFGKAGKTLDGLFAKNGIARAQYGRANIVRCRPPENRKPTKTEVNSCIEHLADFIAKYKPSVILCVGQTATAQFLGGGNLNVRIGQQQMLGFQPSPLLSHSALRSVSESGQFKVVPMPHTSPLAFNRNAPDGRKWSAVASEMVEKAVYLSSNKG